MFLDTQKLAVKFAYKVLIKKRFLRVMLGHVNYLALGMRILQIKRVAVIVNQLGKWLEA